MKDLSGLISKLLNLKSSSASDSGGASYIKEYKSIFMILEPIVFLLMVIDD